MAKPSRLQVEIDSVEREINVQEQLKALIQRGDTIEDVNAELTVLEKVHSRLCSVLPPVSASITPVVKRSRKKGMLKKEGEA